MTFWGMDALHSGLKNGRNCILELKSFGGDPRILLIRESLVTGVLGIACLVSLLLPKPLIFYFAPPNAAFYQLWQYPSFKRYMTLMTIAWGIFFIKN
jgi:uncharacterized membrane protein